MSTSRRRVAVLVVTGVLAAAGLFVIAYQVTLGMLDANEPAPVNPAAAPAADPVPTSSTTPWVRRECRPVATTDEIGEPVNEFFLNQVRAVHDAACRRDYDALFQQMDEPFNGLPPAQVIAEWRQAGEADVRLETLAETLEVKGTLTQGGLFFCHPDGGVAIFGRGTLDHPGKWASFSISPGATSPCQEFRIK